MKVALLLLLSVLNVGALTFDNVQLYMRQNADVSYAQYFSILRNGMLVWEPVDAPGAQYRVYYGSSPSTYTSRKDVGAATTFAMPVTLTGKKYYMVVKTLLNGKESVPSREFARDKK